jgi:hypothetical protein
VGGGRSARGADFPAMLGCRASRGTRFVRCAHCARTAAASLMVGRAARAARHPALLGAPHARPPEPAPALADEPPLAYASLPSTASPTFFVDTVLSSSRQGVIHDDRPPLLRGCRVPVGRACAATSSAVSGSARAQRAHHHQDCRSCPSAVSAANEASSAARSRREQHSAVGPQGRPPHPLALPEPDSRATAR